MIFFYKRYPDAGSATAISVFGGVFIAGAIALILACIFSGGKDVLSMILVAAVMGGIGFLLRWLADKRAVSVWRKKGMLDNHRV